MNPDRLGQVVLALSIGTGGWLLLAVLRMVFWMFTDHPAPTTLWQVMGP